MTTNVVMYTPNLSGNVGDITLAGVNGYFIDLEPYASDTVDPYRQRWTIQPDGNTFLIKNGTYDIWLTDQGYGNDIGFTYNRDQATPWLKEVYNNLWVIFSSYNTSLVITAVGNKVKLLAKITNQGDPSQQWYLNPN